MCARTRLIVVLAFVAVGIVLLGWHSKRSRPMSDAELATLVGSQSEMDYCNGEETPFCSEVDWTCDNNDDQCDYGYPGSLCYGWETYAWPEICPDTWGGNYCDGDSTTTVYCVCKWHGHCRCSDALECVMDEVYGDHVDCRAQTTDALACYYIPCTPP